jgi:hypothetical protein
VGAGATAGLGGAGGGALSNCATIVRGGSGGGSGISRECRTHTASATCSTTTTANAAANSSREVVLSLRVAESKRNVVAGAISVVVAALPCRYAG